MKELAHALEVLALGEPIVLPTDTVYGIAVRPDLPEAVARVFRAKGRPEDKPLPVLGASVEALEGVALLNEAALRLAERFWPGPLTLVLARAPGCTADLGGSNDGTVAVRIPAFTSTLELLARSGPLAVTSANASGAPPAHTVEEARAALGHSVSVFLDGGAVHGSPSTVVSLLDEPRVLRKGAVTERDVLSSVGGSS